MPDLGYLDWIVIILSVGGLGVAGLGLFLAWTQMPERRDR